MAAVSANMTLRIWDWLESLEPKHPGDSHVVFFVGPEEEMFHVERDVVMKFSLFFEGVVRGPFKEAFTTTFYLPETSPAVFKLFLDWKATKHLPVFSAIRRRSCVAAQASGAPVLRRSFWDENFIPACEFAFTHSMPDFEEALQKIFMDAYFPRCEDSLEAFDAFPSGDLLLRLHDALLPNAKLLQAISRAYNEFFNNLLAETIPQHLHPAILEYRAMMRTGHPRSG
ncbi:hypothetical protein IWX90DRAFT_8385 [Phyllosticta citrichinensis]|uniref:BTB domain-containing protein n=1 Tax=Phyllosticta citrichinensis TaxID=1130410 RepID=A0ABR1Y634_9PEZI